MSIVDVLYPSGRKELGNMKVMSQETAPLAMRTMPIKISGGYTVIPIVSPDGRELTTEEAIIMYKETGSHFGIFQTPEEARIFSEALDESNSRETGSELTTLGHNFDGSF